MLGMEALMSFLDSRNFLSSLFLVCGGACGTILLEALAGRLGRHLARRSLRSQAGMATANSGEPNPRVSREGAGTQPPRTSTQPRFHKPLETIP
jgi:hypothetical protein